MFKDHEDTLRKYGFELVRNVIISEDFLSVLRKDNTISDIAYQEIQAEKTKQGKVGKLLSELLRMKLGLERLETKQDSCAELLDRNLAKQYQMRRDGEEENIEDRELVYRRSEDEPDHKRPAIPIGQIAKIIQKSNKLYKKVVRSTQQFIEQYQQRKDVYRVMQRRGHVIMINNMVFARHKSRPSAQEDYENINTLFEKHLKYTVAKDFNLSNKEMMILLKSNCEWLNTNSLTNPVDVLVIVIMSHGKENIVFDINSEPLNIIPDILSVFSDDNCPAMKGKPKLYLFQACQGNQISSGQSNSTQARQGGQTGLAGPAEQPVTCEEICYMDDDISAYPDILMGFSSYTGYKSWKDNFGSWYIRTLIYVLAHYSYQDDILALMRRVTNIVSELRTGHETQLIQLPQIIETLSSKLYLLP